MKIEIRRVSCVSILALAIFFSGCATIIRGKTQLIPISSNPSGASIKVYDEKNYMIYEGTTPSQVNLTKKGAGYFEGKSYRLVIEQPGYETQEIRIEPHASGWYIGGNILVGGLIGWLIVDPITGSMWTYNEKITENITLKGKETAMLKSGEGSFGILLKQDVDPKYLPDITPVSVSTQVA